MELFHNLINFLQKIVNVQANDSMTKRAFKCIEPLTAIIASLTLTGKRYVGSVKHFNL